MQRAYRGSLPKSICIVEDDDSDFYVINRFISKQFKDGTHVKRFVDLDSLINHNDDTNPDITFLDLGLPDSKGINSLKACMKSFPGCPIIVLTGDDNEENGLEAINLGAQDFLYKGDLTEGLLFRTTLHAIKRKQLENEIDKQKKISINSVKLASLGKLTMGIAHEINNPISIIALLSSRTIKNIQKKNLEDRLKDEINSIDRIHKTSHYIGSVVKTLSAFNRGESLEPFESVRLRDLVNEVKQLIDLNIKSSRVKIEFNSTFSYDLKIEAQKSEIMQVLFILINNAIDAVEKINSKWISIDVRDAIKSVTIIVQDSGGGIPEDLRKNITKPFFTTKMDGKGMGLGLSIAQQIIHKHGGKLKLDSSQKNTTFVVSLPKFSHQEKLSSKVIKNEEISKVLLVEDDPILMSFYVNWFSDPKFKITECVHGIQGALELMKEDMSFDILVTDINMPMKTGTDLLKNLISFKHKDLNKLNIVVCSAFIQKDVIEEFKDYKNIKFLEKPINKEKLFKVLGLEDSEDIGVS